jgi:glycosyltransferase involved in cell wall biosynthesis
MAGPVTVLLPTHKRPQMLGQALESIALQSRKDLIHEVVISESAATDESRSVARSFSEKLPIRYLKQSGNLTAQANGIRLSLEAKTEYVALLADDDMWSRYHLEEAFRCFAENPTIHAYFGQAVAVANECCMPYEQFSGSFLQVPKSDERTLRDFEFWGCTETAVNCLANTPLNIWSAVVLAESHRRAINSSAGDPVFGQYPSNDRLYLWRLGMFGSIGIGRQLSIFYRRHQDSDVQTHLRKDIERTFAEDSLISQEIIRQAKLMGIDPIAEWRKYYELAKFHGLADRIQMTPQLKRLLLPEADNQNSVDPSNPTEVFKARVHSQIKRTLYLFTPPVVQVLRNKLQGP